MLNLVHLTILKGNAGFNVFKNIWPNFSSFFRGFYFVWSVFMHNYTLLVSVSELHYDDLNRNKHLQTVGCSLTPVVNSEIM